MNDMKISGRCPKCDEPYGVCKCHQQTLEQMRDDAARELKELHAILHPPTAPTVAPGEGQDCGRCGGSGVLAEPNKWGEPCNERQCDNCEGTGKLPTPSPDRAERGESATPRTDDQVRPARLFDENEEAVRADFARTLERELAAANARADAWKETADNATLPLAESTKRIIERAANPMRFSDLNAFLLKQDAQLLSLSQKLQGAEMDRGRLADVIRWALGEVGEFPDWPESVTIKGNPKYWWRKELRARFDAARAPNSPRAMQEDKGGDSKP